MGNRLSDLSLGESWAEFGKSGVAKRISYEEKEQFILAVMDLP